MSEPMSEVRAMEMQKRLDRAFRQGLSHGALGEASTQQLQKIAAELGFAAFTGTVTYVGRTSTDSVVDFEVAGGLGYVSSWPAWAFEQAKLALTSGRKLWVAANGDPHGSNLSAVVVLGA